MSDMKTENILSSTMAPPYDGEIYTFESLAAKDAGGVGKDGETSRKDATSSS